MPSKAPFTVVSDDPEVMALQALIRGISHASARQLEMRHLTILSAVQLCRKVMKKEPNATQIGLYAGLRPAEFASELLYLVENRYLVETMPSFGEIIMTYRVGPMGGKVLANMGLNTKKPKEMN